MVDIFSKDERSEIMRSVKSKGNKSTELKLISFFRLHKITCWRRNINLIGKPDFVFSKRKIVVFVDGCFWHGHNCRNTNPKENADYWSEKIKRNKKRDRDVTKELKNKNWIVIRIWECEIKDEKLQKKLSCLL
mgnify:CR=1 FL=1